MTTLMQSGSICLVALVFVSATSADDQIAEAASTDTAIELSAAPLDLIEYPDDRPAWLNQGPDLESKTHTWVVVTRPCENEQECAEKLEVLQRAAVNLYIQELTNSEDVDFYPVNDKWIESQLIAKSYQGSLVEGDVPMVEQAVMLEFTPRTQQEILAAAENLQVGQRLGKLGVLVFFGLVMLIGSSSLLGIVGRRVERRSQQLPAH